MQTYEKKGYLNNDFRIFHLCDSEQTRLKEMTFDYHYHDFNKIILFLSGDVTYSVEGRKYDLKPYDIVMIKEGEIHMPVIRSTTPYERIIIYISSEYMQQFRGNTYDLGNIWEHQRGTKTGEYKDGADSAAGFSHVLRMKNPEQSILFEVCRRMEDSFTASQGQEASANAYANELYQRVLFVEFLILLNRALLEKDVSFLENTGTHKKTAEIIDHINENLFGELSVDGLAAHFYMSRSYLMHLFKEETGYSVGSYINEKRLFAAKNKIRDGMSVTDACYSSGFHDYSTFSRAFRKKFGTTPKNSGKLK